MICYQIIDWIESGFEHELFKLGKSAFSHQQYEIDDQLRAYLEHQFGKRWKQKRHHHLIRLGGDIKATGLFGYSKETILGGMVTLASKL